jgi:hypothetical protein
MRPLVLIAAGLFVMFGVPDVSQFRDWLPVPVVAPVEVDRVVLVYEKDRDTITPAVRSALNTLNRKGIHATLFEDDNTNGMDQVPTQYRLPLEAARGVDRLALVVMAGGKVLRVVPEPKTEEDVLEVAQ